MSDGLFKPGLRSLYALRGIHPELRRATDYAYVATTQDFSVIQGRRSAKEQEAAVASGNSRTLHSRHLTGHAIDFAPYFPGSGISWKWPGFFPVVKAYHRAATDLGIALRWGGVWDRPLTQLNPENLEGEQADYVRRFKHLNPGKSPLLDLGHIELKREVYP